MWHEVRSSVVAQSRERLATTCHEGHVIVLLTTEWNVDYSLIYVTTRSLCHGYGEPSGSIIQWSPFPGTPTGHRSWALFDSYSEVPDSFLNQDTDALPWVLSIPPDKCRAVILNEKFWEELITYFLLTRHGPHRKWRLQQCFVAAGTPLSSCYLSTIGGCTDPQTHTFNNSSIVACIRCQGILFTEPLSSNDRRDTQKTDGRDLWIAPLRWVQVPWYTFQVS
jgi:hypothetical protein